MKVIIGSDHAGVEAKEYVKEILTKHHYQYEDMGTDSKELIDYPDVAKKVCNRILENTRGQEYIESNSQFSQNTHSNIFGILICGSGTGMQIAANRIGGIRAAFCYDIYSATMARNDNDANVLTLRSREFNWEYYEAIITTFLETSFSYEQRHSRRIEKLK